METVWCLSFDLRCQRIEFFVSIFIISQTIWHRFVVLVLFCGFVKKKNLLKWWKMKKNLKPNQLSPLSQKSDSFIKKISHYICYCQNDFHRKNTLYRNFLKSDGLSLLFCGALFLAILAIFHEKNILATVMLLVHHPSVKVLAYYFNSGCWRGNISVCTFWLAEHYLYSCQGICANSPGRR